MATETTGETRAEFADVEVVDCDVHVSYAENVQRQVAQRMDEPWAGYADPEETPQRYRKPSPGLPKPLGGRKSFHVGRGLPHRQMVQEDLVEGLGVDYPILNIIGLVDTLFKTDRAIEEMRGINDVLVEEFLDHDEDYRGLMTLSLQDPPRTAEEIDRLGDEDQVVGAFVYYGTNYQQPAGDPSHDIIFQALEDNDLTPAFHTSNYIQKATHLRDLENLFAWHSLALGWAVQEATVSLISQGVPEKFPDLDFVMMEGGVGWLPFIMGRMNREYGQWRQEVPYLEKSPEQYVRDRFYFSTQPVEEFDDPTHMKQVLDIVGTESLLFATDYPHYDFDDPSAIDRFLKQFSAEDRQQVLSGNAKEAFGLSV